jgi:hypothetical protein
LAKRSLFKRICFWVHVRWELHKTLMNDKLSVELIHKRDNLIIDREVLRFISQRQCTAPTFDQCINLRPKDPKDWCCRCLALDHLIATEKGE